MRRPAGVALAVALAAAAFVPGVASAQAPSCTLVVTEDTTLDRDISCDDELGGVAIEIAAANITLDLGGHSVSADFGIRNQGFDGVTIKNGFVVGDSHGAILIEHADRNTVRDLDINDIFAGALVLTDVDHSHIARNRVIGGLFLRQGSDRNVVKDNNTGSFHDGLSVFDGSSRNLIIGNTSNTGSDSGVYVGASTGNVLALNTASSYRDGVFVDAAAERTLLIGNRTHGSQADDGIDTESRSTVVIANTANDNGDYGIEAVPGVFAVGNRASGNGDPAQCLNVRCR